MTTSYYVTDTNKTLKNTYGLLALATGFSAVMAYVNMQIGLKITPILLVALYFGLIWLVHKFKDSGLGIVLVFAITGLLGFSTGPLIQHYIQNVPNGSELIMQAFLGTAVIFTGINIYTAVAKPKLNEAWLPAMFWITAVAMGLGLINYYFLEMSILSVMISAVFLVISSIYLVYQTNAIINGGETNYVLATVGIFVSLYNILISLINILGFSRN
jgi:modulator of FtsH protease